MKELKFALEKLNTITITRIIGRHIRCLFKFCTTAFTQLHKHLIQQHCEVFSARHKHKVIRGILETEQYLVNENESN